MHNHGHSCLFLGIPLFVKFTKNARTLQRFDPKTGSPIEIVTEVLNLFITDEKGNGFDTFPDDTEIFEERLFETGFVSKDWNQWQEERINRRLYNWLKSHGIDNYDQTPPSKLFYLEWDRFFHLGRYFEKRLDDSLMVVIGRMIASGSGGGRTATQRVPTNIEQVAKEVQEAFTQTFGDAVDHMDITPSLFLRTTA